MKNFFDFNKIQIRLASPAKIRGWSCGEVKKPETINYRTLKPEREGLFCEKIFGTTRDWECYCGKFKSIRYKGVVCDKCGVEVSHSKVRRERMGSIELSYPVAHIWYYRTVPSRIALALNMTANDVKSILYFEKYVIIEPGESGVEYKQLVTQEEYYRLIEQHGDKIYGSIGADAIKELLSNINAEEDIREIREIIEAKAKITDKRILKRLDLLESFVESGNHFEWMVLDVLPVLPPELRPMVQLDGGRFATSDLNDLYRRVINRNNRLKRLLTLKAPDIIVSNEKRMLQESVDALFDNSRRKKSIKGKGNRPLKSLSDMLKGKQGRFRQNLLGKRVDYSGRTVIVVGPHLKMYQCGLPKKMALELFKPFMMKWLVENGHTQNIKSAKRMIEGEEKIVFQGLEEMIHEHPVLLNRAPTLHRLGIQAFLPVLVEGKAIQLPPLVCHAFNADFDGDQMAIHLPLSPKSQLESWFLLLSVHNILNPANGSPIVGPTQDMILGLYYLTAEKENSIGEGQLFDNIDTVLFALEFGVVEHQTKIQYFIDNRLIETTPGKLIFNELLPKGFGFVNRHMTSQEINQIILDIYKQKGTAVTVNFLDKIKEIGFEYSTYFAPTMSIDDIKIPSSKKTMIEQGHKEVERVQNEYRKGTITDEERYKKVIEIWSNINEGITEDLYNVLSTDMDGFNPIYSMAVSGAKGSRSQIRQLAGMRGLMAKPSGDIIELPIISNFKEGLGILEFFISTHGARKGLADTALKTADAGYLTRRLVDIAQDVIVREHDCGTKDGFFLTADKEDNQIIVSLKQKIYGRCLAEDIYDSSTDEIIFKNNEFVTEEMAQSIENFGYEKVKIRSVLICETLSGVCSKCYGMDLSTLRSVEEGEAVGIIAAQSIGQPGTQLTMRTFHIGGTATTKVVESTVKALFRSLVKEVQGIKITAPGNKGKYVMIKRGGLILIQVLASYLKDELIDYHLQSGARVVRGESIAKRQEGDKLIPVLASTPGEILEKDGSVLLTGQTLTIQLHAGAVLHVAKDDMVEANALLMEYDPYNSLLLAPHDGRIEYIDIEEGKTLKLEEMPGITGQIAKVVSSRQQKMLPSLHIYDKGKLVSELSIPFGAILLVKNGAQVAAGEICAKIETKAEKTRDITGGLPRVEELFEARHPKSPCHLAEIDGIIHDTGHIVRDKKVIEIIPEDASPEEIEEKKVSVSIPMHKQLLVHNGAFVQKGDHLDDGGIDPHEILRVQGEGALQRYLIREIQEVYRLQGVYINDKHLEVMLSQMMHKLEIVETGDTSFVPMSYVDKLTFKLENKEVVEKGGAPARGTPVLMGLTKASLYSDSFLSAASFQETTKVLTDAAIKGKSDPLNGLKENIIIGHLIPAGTGIRRYQDIRVYKNLMGDIYYTPEEESMLYNPQVDKQQIHENITRISTTTKERVADDDKKNDTIELNQKIAGIANS